MFRACADQSPTKLSGSLGLSAVALGGGG